MRKLISALCLLLRLMMLCCAPIALGEKAENVVYYNPDGGRYYHAKPDCETMSSEYYAMMQPIPVSELDLEPYTALERCVLCFGEELSATPPPYFCHREDDLQYAMAPDGFLLDKAGEYTCGVDFPAGIYTFYGDGVTQGEISIFTQDGTPLHTFFVSSRETASFYLVENMRLTLPQGLTMRNMTHVARFQSVLEVTDITSARYFMLLECPGRKYWVQSKPGQEGSLMIYNIEAELGLSEPQCFTLPVDEPVSIDLSGLFNHFVELHNCLIWFTEAGVG